MREREREFLEYWLTELKHEAKDYQDELNIINNKKMELRLQKKILGELIVANHSFVDEKEKFKNHFDYNGILEGYKEINSDEKAEQESQLREKIIFTELAIEKVEDTLKQYTPA